MRATDFVQLPPIRQRGRHHLDATARPTTSGSSPESPCNKRFTKLASLTAGIFTVVCEHGTRVDTAYRRCRCACRAEACKTDMIQ